VNYYFHIPFCRSKCGYCAFYSEPAPAPTTIDRYLDHLERQLAAAPLPPAETVYFGGGTPTLMELPQLKRLFGMVERFIVPSSDCEVSIEANPETLDAAKIALLREHTTRLSLGVQSFSSRRRAVLGRRCGDDALKNAVELIRNAAFPHWNIDLIYAVPGEDAAAWRDDLRRAADTGIDHLSCYSLTPEENSRLGTSFKIDEDLAAELYEMIPDILAPYGINRYEISNYARPGARCRHNGNVWRGGMLRGFGPAAAGFDGRDRMTEPESLSQWLAGAPPAADRIPLPARLAEIFAVNLRTVDGWTPEMWQLVPGADPWASRIAAVEKLLGIMPVSWWKISPGGIKLSAEGLGFWNDVAEAMLI